jgi:hypothetical protein
MGVNENHIPSTTRYVQVSLTIISPKQPPTIEAKVIVGGVQIQRIAIVAEEAQRWYTATFVCAPGEAWQLAVAGAWSCEAAYRVLGHE